VVEVIIEGVVVIGWRMSCDYMGSITRPLIASMKAPRPRRNMRHVNRTPIKRSPPLSVSSCSLGRRCAAVIGMATWRQQWFCVISTQGGVETPPHPTPPPFYSTCSCVYRHSWVAQRVNDRMKRYSWCLLRSSILRAFARNHMKLEPNSRHNIKSFLFFFELIQLKFWQFF
jgi:hypothetical protein